MLTALVARLAFVTEQSGRLAVAAVAALIARLAFIAEEARRLGRSDSLFQLFDL